MPGYSTDYYTGLDGLIATSDCRSLSQSFGDSFFELEMVKNSRITG